MFRAPFWIKNQIHKKNFPVFHSSLATFSTVDSQVAFGGGSGGGGGNEPFFLLLALMAGFLGFYFRKK